MPHFARTPCLLRSSFMREPTEHEIAKYTPRYDFTREINLEDQWRGKWVAGEELPERAPVNFAYAVVLWKDRGYVTRRVGEDNWRTVEVAMELGDDPEPIVTEAVFQQTGAKVSELFLNGWFDCKPTILNEDVSGDAIRVRPLYLAVAESVEDVPEGSGFQRRRLPVNEFAVAMRRRYPEVLEHIRMAIDQYVVKRAKGEL